MTATTTTPTVQEQASAVLAHAAGYASHRTIAIGLRSGLLEALAASEHTTPEELAERLGMDPFYVSVWCRAAYAAGICDRDAGRYRLAAHMATLLLDATSPAYTGASSPSWSNTRCSAASRPASPPASGSGGTRPAPTGSPGSPAPAPPSTPALSPAGFSRSRGCPNGWRPAPRSSTAHAAPGSGWSVWPPTIPLAGSSGSTATVAQSSRRASASPRPGWPTGSALSAARWRSCAWRRRRRWWSTTSRCTSARHRPGHRADPRLPGAGGLVRDLRLPVPRW
jgi:hypothetical protein